MSATKATATSTRSPTIKRILREAAEMSNSPSPDYDAQPLESDLFEWHFTLRGPPNSVYSHGIYHGRILLPSAYPLRPPMFRFNTPNGRFEANREICLSISGHHEETWQPAWGIRTALVALRSFMETEARGQLGGLEASDDVRRNLAKESGGWTCPACARSNAEIIKACQKRYQQSDGDNAPDDTIPQELSMVWKDEIKSMSASKEASASDANAEADELAEAIVEADELAEAIVEAKAKQPETVHQRPAAALTGAARVNDHPATKHTASTSPERGQASTNNNQIVDNNIPLWIDRAIVVLGILLMALLAKVLLGF